MIPTTKGHPHVGPNRENRQRRQLGPRISRQLKATVTTIRKSRHHHHSDLSGGNENMEVKVNKCKGKKRQQVEGQI